MAQISSGSEKILNITKWGGLHQCSDGDTRIEIGEAADVRNFAVTRDGSLKKRSGTRSQLVLTQNGVRQPGKPVRGLWSGIIASQQRLIAACDGHLWSCCSGGAFAKTDLGTLNTDSDVFMFAFSGKLYILNGTEYKVWDGTVLSDVAGYRPLVRITVTAEGGGTVLEQINKLTPCRRCRISPDGTSLTYPLPEKGIASLDYVTDLASGSAVSGCSCDKVNGTVTFSSAPAAGTDTVEIGYSASSSYRSQVTAMRFGEIYNGTSDARVFLYGDGSNTAFYSDLDSSGQSRADYFPDMNQLSIGEGSTPITAMIRHYAQLIVFKSDSTWTVQYGTQTLADGSVTAAFYVVPVNRAIGCAAPGQVCLVNNAPYTLYNGELYEWRNSNAYAANLTLDERQARRISDRIYAALSQYELSRCTCFDDNRAQEYYICCDGEALVYNYAVDAWYRYTAFDALKLAAMGDRLLFGSSDGALKELSPAFRSDDGAAIDAYWESGDMDMLSGCRVKSSAALWLALKPESHTDITVTVRTDRDTQRSAFARISSLADFTAADLRQWSFSVNRRPRLERLHLRAKNFVYYKLIIRSDTLNSAATVLGANIAVRYSGYGK